jgi:predicted ATP-grasp superfamily ATP-dependent carboligase
MEVVAMATRFNLPLLRFDPHRPPVLLLGGTNLVRTLGLAGIPAIVASADPEEPAFASRHCTGRCLIPRLDSGKAAANALVSLGDRLTAQLGRRVPLMYGSDDALQLLHAHRERLQRYFLFLVPERDVGTALTAKDAFARLARDRGLPVPRELSWDGLREVRCEVLTKPRVKVDWHHSTLCERLFDGEGKARVFASGEEAASHPVVRHHHDQLVFQEYIPGDDTCLWSFHGFADEHGNVLASFVGRKIRTYPAGNGESAFIELAHDASLEAVGREVVAKLPLKGVFKMDFKRDPRDGRWLLLEINARFTLWNYLAAANGLNLMEAVYGYLVEGEPPRPRRVHNTYRWLAAELDFKAYRELAARGELDAIAWIRSIASSRNIYNVFAWRDLGPWIFFWRARISRKGARAGERLMGMVRQWRSTAS